MSVPSGSVVRNYWEVLDSNSNAVSALTASNFTISLTRKITGSNNAFSAASESVTVAELASTGTYVFSYTPLTDGYTYKLTITELANYSLSLERSNSWTTEVGGSSVNFSEDDAFCSVSDVEAYAQRGNYSTTSNPNLSQVLGFMAQRAGSIQALMASYGAPFTVDTGSNPIPSSSTPLRYIARQMNAIAAAIDAVIAHETGQAPAQSQKVDELLKIYASLESSLVQYIERVVSGSVAGNIGVATDISSGGVTAATFPNPASSTTTNTGKYDWTMNRDYW
jgi:hypothetical protein